MNPPWLRALRPGGLLARLAKLLIPAAAVLAPLASQACGACVEDSVAATYDHQVVQHATTAGKVVVFCQVAGQFDAPQLVKSARRVQGVSAQSVRTSGQPPALSFAFDAARQSSQDAVAAIQRSLPAGTRLSIVRVMK